MPATSRSGPVSQGMTRELFIRKMLGSLRELRRKVKPRPYAADPMWKCPVPAHVEMSGFICGYRRLWSFDCRGLCAGDDPAACPRGIRRQVHRPGAFTDERHPIDLARDEIP